ncbi:hypothetical protein JCM10908_000666 [Rhodotorula pacifica]|uniref:uncharacterized protein n=1 Tax=Rhodotorula pacifica TaxID=1495444 RepID=UPI0031738FB6
MEAGPSQCGQAQRPPELIVLAGVVGSGKSTLSQAWQRHLPDWVRVNQDDLGDRRTCEAAVRNALARGKNVVVDRQNFDAGQRRTWLEIANEFPGVRAGGMVMGTTKEECRARLLTRTDHPTIDNPALAVSLLDKFSGLWEEPRLDEGFDQLITLPPLPPAPEIDATLIRSLLDLLHRSPTNPLAASQRTPRARPAPYMRSDGFVDDGTWRPPPPLNRPPSSSSFQYQNRAPAPPAYSNVGPAFGYRPPQNQTAWSRGGPPPQPTMYGGYGTPYQFQGSGGGGPPWQTPQQQQPYQLTTQGGWRDRHTYTNNLRDGSAYNSQQQQDPHFQPPRTSAGTPMQSSAPISADHPLAPTIPQPPT